MNFAPGDSALTISACLGVEGSFKRFWQVLLALLMVISGQAASAEPSEGNSSQASSIDRPNILWITAEDMSPTLGCYGDAYATTPHLDALAKQSVRYLNAFASAPVCSPARSCLITGSLATTLGTHQMRSVFPIPKHIKGFPALLRQAGYYTSNNVKTDYNTANAEQIIKASWDESSQRAGWGQRQAGQPFFCVFNLMVSHQSRSMVWSYEKFQQEVQSQFSKDQIHNPQQAPVPPYYPDTPLVRKTIARYYDCVTAMDQQVGEILHRLEKDGLAEETIVFFYSDHGSGMPRHKRALLDSGMKVPLLIRFPKKFQHLAPRPPGTTTNRLVSFVDFPPTVLQLAGVKQSPDSFEGQVFLGPAAEAPRRYVYGHRDRIDEAVDLARSVRDKHYLYIRNYLPQLGYHQPSAWPDQGEIRQALDELAKSTKLTPAQRQFLSPTRPIEELYDCQQDPLNLQNLANSREHQHVLRRMQAAHKEWVLTSRDLGFLPETEQWKRADGQTPYQWARGPGYRLPAIFQAASLVGTNSATSFAKNLLSADPAIRYWGACGYVAAESLSQKDALALKRALQDDSEIVRIAAADALARHGHLRQALPILTELFDHQDPTVILYAARTVELLGQQAASAYADVKALNERFRDKPGDPAWFIRFTTSGFLHRVRPPSP